MVRILGIESSCDETAAAVVEDGNRILSSIIGSQFDIHAQYGGVVPELASREHLRAIVPVVRETLRRASLKFDDLDAVAVTVGPGLIGSLLVGITYAQALCFSRGLPLIAVNHVEGHIHSVVLETKMTGGHIDFPALALVVSGGHTHLFVVEELGRYRLLGKTRDDAAGEAYDKVGKLLGLGWPGGPTMDRLAPFGNPKAVKFSLARMKGNEIDFSFSGLKTAALRWTEQNDIAVEVAARKALLREHPKPTIEQWLSVTPNRTLDMIASFQNTVIEELLRRTVASAEQLGTQSVIVSGGVACNAGLQKRAQALRGISFHFPSLSLATDNAAMIAAAAFPKFERGEFSDLTLRPSPNLSLT